MSVSPSKENILKKIREALSHSTPLPFPQSESNQPVFPPLEQEIEVEFAEQFTQLQGKFIFCINQQELAFQLSSLVKKQNWEKLFCMEDKLIASVASQISDRIVKTGLADCDASITGCEWLVRRNPKINVVVRRIFRLHLSTALLAMLLAGTMLWVNLRPGIRPGAKTVIESQGRPSASVWRSTGSRP